jgi:hypothetical protein
MMAEGGTHRAATHADFMTWGVQGHYLIIEKAD